MKLNAFHRFFAGSRRSLQADPESATVSVVIPVKNAGDSFRSLLATLRAQDGPRIADIVVVDSGSEDATLDTARDFGARVVTIPASEFSHSKARNLGAEHASGDYLLFTVQDALPPSATWLRELFDPFRREDVVGVSCGECPRDDADLFYRAISWDHHRFLQIDARDRILTMPRYRDPVSLRKSAQLSDTACLIRKDVFSRYRFRGDYAEDLDLGLRLIRDGFRLALLGRTRILHSHNRPAYYHLRRGYVDQLALLRILPGHPATVVSPETLPSDVVQGAAWVDEIASEVLGSVDLPCSVRDWRAAVAAAFRRDRTPGAERPPASLDPQCIAFLERLAPAPGVRRPAGESPVMQATGGFANLLLDYVADVSATVDRPLARDFTSALYKGWALQCGVLLASSFTHGDDGTGTKLGEVHRELCLGV